MTGVQTCALPILIDQEDSFTDTLFIEQVDDLYMNIAGELFDEWNDSNLNEGLLYADYQLASRSNDKSIIDAYHEHWGLVEGDEYYID